MNRNGLAPVQRSAGGGRRRTPVLAFAALLAAFPLAQLAARGGGRGFSGGSVRQTNVGWNQGMSGVSTPAPPIPTQRPAEPSRPQVSPYRVDYGDVDVYNGSRATVAVGEQGAAAIGARGGTVVSTDRGVAATGPSGSMVAGERGVAAQGSGGAALVVEGGAGAVQRQGDVYYGEVYEDYDEYAGQRVVAGVVTGVAIGTILATPPTGAAAVTAGGSGYYYSDNSYFVPVYDEGDVAYQAVAAPVGATVDELPSGCTTWTIGDVTYSQCGIVTYQHVPGGYLVVDS